MSIRKFFKGVGVAIIVGLPVLLAVAAALFIFGFVFPFFLTGGWTPLTVIWSLF
jgi:hypothetical protein